MLIFAGRVTAEPPAAMVATLGSATLVKIAPTSLPLRLETCSGYELRGHPTTESPSAETRQGVIVARFQI
jgi:hypothetical protein